jgi:hypothetical protein
LIQKNRDDYPKLVELFSKARLFSHKEMIAKDLIKSGTEHILYEVDNAVSATMILYHCKDFDINTFFNESKDLLKFTFSEDSLAKYYFSQLTEKQRLYILLAYYGIGNYIELQDYGINFYSTSIYFPAVKDAKRLGFDQFTKYFDQVFDKGFNSMDEKLLILALLLDRSRYKERVDEIGNSRNIVLNLESQTVVLTKRYVRLIREEKDDSKIESLLKEKEREIGKLLLKSDYEKLKELFNRDLNIKDFNDLGITLPPLREFYGKPIDILSLDPKIKVTKVYEEEKDRIIKGMEDDITDLDQVDDIIEVKDKANRKIESLIPRNRFCLAVRKLKKTDANKSEYIDILGTILVRNKDPEVRKSVLQFSLNSKSSEWVKYLRKMFPIRDDKVTMHSYAAALNIPNAENIIHIMDILDVKTGIDQNFLLISLLEHFHFFYYNGKRGDLDILYRAQERIYNLKDQRKSGPISDILMRIIDRIENRN